MRKRIIQYLLTFLTAACMLIGLLLASTQISREAIRDNMMQSATFLRDDALFGARVDNVDSSIIDHYADAILLGIAYQYDKDAPLTSVMQSAYYHEENANENDNLYTAVEQGKEANQQYLRYWHGSILLVRPLLMLFDIQQIYVLNAVVLCLLTVILLAGLVRQRAYAPAVGVMLGCFMTSAWFVPLSLEYTWTYLFMLLFSLIGLGLVKRKRLQLLGYFFLIAGMVTSFVDFLTAETLTLTIPLLLILGMDKGKKEVKNPFHLTLKAAGSWGAGYIGMWLLKWLLASAVLSENVMPYVSGHIEERIGGGLRYNAIAILFRAIGRNMRCLFPFEYGLIGVLAGIGLIVGFLYLGYVYHGTHIDRRYILVYGIIGLVPYFRYAVLLNHSFLHYFFTYRAQLATVLAAVLILEQVTKGMLPVFGRHKKVG